MTLLITHAFLRLTGALLAVVLSSLMALFSSVGVVSGANPEFYDVPFANNQWKIGRRVDESKLRYCIDQSPTPTGNWLLKSSKQLLGRYCSSHSNTWSIAILLYEDITRIYAIMLEHCDIHMGFQVAPWPLC